MNIHIGDEIELLSGELLSLLYFEADDFTFPHAEWCDFIHPLLCVWANELMAHQNSKNARYILYYLRGPYRIRIFQNEKAMLELTFQRDGKTHGIFQLSFKEFADILYEALHKTRALLYENELNEQEPAMQKINDCMRELKRVIQRQAAGAQSA